MDAGSSLASVVDHIWVLTLPGASTRVTHMRSLLEGDLRLPPSFVTYFDGAACREWGMWPPWLLAMRTEQRPNWWLSPRVCDDDDEGRGSDAPPPCLQTRYRRCVNARSQEPRPAVCNELCYTLSVVGALRDFLNRKGVKRALFLEDDVCATSALHAPSSSHALSWLASHRGAWDLVKLGDCFRGFRAFFGMRRRMPQDEVLATGTCASSGGGTHRSAAALPNNTLLHGLPWAYCTHALAVSRRMAAYLISQAFPASDVFDNLLASHIAPQVRHTHDTLQLWAFNQSLFAQIGKVTPASILPSALLSYERSVGHGGAGARGPVKTRHRASVYRRARPIG